MHAQLEELVPRGLSRPELEAGVAAVARLEAHAVERRLAFLAEMMTSTTAECRVLT